jgi:hypothetical protein
MPVPKKKTNRKSLKGRKSTVVFATPIAAKETLFPEKLAKAKKLLRNAEWLDPRFGPSVKD